MIAKLSIFNEFTKFLLTIGIQSVSIGIKKIADDDFFGIQSLVLYRNLYCTQQSRSFRS